MRRALWALEPVTGAGDPAIARLAARQRGLVHRIQLSDAGIGRHALAHRLARARLVRLLPDVFAVASANLDAPLVAETAAALQLHRHGVLSHLTAGAIWGLLDCRPEPKPVCVTVIDSDVGRRLSLKVVRVGVLNAQEMRRRQSLPVTSPARTLLDLAGVLEADELEAALAGARRRNLVRDAQLRATLARAPKNAKGVAIFRALVQRSQSAADTRSSYERKLRRLIALAELPAAESNVDVEGHLVDAYWRDLRLAVEVDGYRFHGGRGSFEKDRRRDQRLAASGHLSLRITARQIDRTPAAVIARLAATVALRAQAVRAAAARDDG